MTPVIGVNSVLQNDSSIVKWRYPDNFKPVYFFILFLFFEKKILRIQKRVTSENQLTKQK